MRVTTFPVVAAMSTLIEHAPLPAVLRVWIHMAAKILLASNVVSDIELIRKACSTTKLPPRPPGNVAPGGIA